MKTTKTLVLSSVAWLGFALAGLAQTPTPSPESPTAAPTLTASVTPTASVAQSATPVLSGTPSATASANRFAQGIKERADRKFKHKGLTFSIDDDDHGVRHNDGPKNLPEFVIPIVAISMFAIFGFPVAIVAVIMMVNWAKTRSLHRTVRMMVEKGQPVPPELLASPAGRPLRPWYDLRRGIILLAVGVGVMFFFLAVAGWDAGVWAFGLIPAIIGAGYILTWRLANKRENLLKQ